MPLTTAGVMVGECWPNVKEKRKQDMPHLEVFCIYCGGVIRDLLLECVPKAKKATAAFAILMELKPGAAFPCPYCGHLIAFDANQKARVPESGWPVVRHGLADLERRKEFDGEPADLPLAEWARKNHWIEPGTHSPLSEYLYAEQAPVDEIVP